MLHRMFLSRFRIAVISVRSQTSVVQCQAINSSSALFCIRQTRRQRHVVVTRRGNAAHTTTKTSSTTTIRPTGRQSLAAVTKTTVLRHSCRILPMDHIRQRTFYPRRSTMSVHQPTTTRLRYRWRCITPPQSCLIHIRPMDQLAWPTQASVEVTCHSIHGGVRQTGSRQTSAGFRLR